MKIWSKDLMLEKLSYGCLQGIKLIWLLSHSNLIQLHKIFNMYTYVICSFAIFNQKLKCAMKSSHMYRFNVHMYFFYFVQVNLSQKLLFLHQLSHNMTTYCSLNYKFNKYVKIPSSEHGENMLCTEIDFDIQNNLCSQHVLHMFWKNKSFWQRFTCT